VRTEGSGAMIVGNVLKRREMAEERGDFKEEDN
jgi:hypothetical protein